MLVTIYKHSIEIISFFFKFFFSSYHWTSAASFNMFKVRFWTHGSHVTPGTWQTPVSWITFFSRFSWVSWKKDVLIKKDSISRLFFFTFTPFRYLCRISWKCIYTSKTEPSTLPGTPGAPGGPGRPGGHGLSEPFPALPRDGLSLLFAKPDTYKQTPRLGVSEVVTVTICLLMSHVTQKINMLPGSVTVRCPAWV